MITIEKNIKNFAAHRHGSKNLLQRAIPYRHEKILFGKGRRPAKTSETIYNICFVFQRIVLIDQFVWASAGCGTRHMCSASVDIGGRSGKILNHRLGEVKAQSGNKKQ